MEHKTELILISIHGTDRPGLTAAITEFLSKYLVEILDMGVAEIHSTITFANLLMCP